MRRLHLDVARERYSHSAVQAIQIPYGFCFLIPELAQLTLIFLQHGRTG